MVLQIEKEKLKEFFSEKMNRRQLIISGIIVVLITAMIMNAVNIENPSNYGKYKVITVDALWTLL